MDNYGLMDYDASLAYNAVLGTTVITGLGLALIGAMIRKIIDKRRNNERFTV